MHGAVKHCRPVIVSVVLTDAVCSFCTVESKSDYKRSSWRSVDRKYSNDLFVCFKIGRKTGNKNTDQHPILS